MNSSKQISSFNVLILAAGLGTRMRSNTAKVLHQIDGRPMINHVCRTALALKPKKIYVVIGHQGEEVRTAVLKEFDESKFEFVIQKKQLGTGDAVNAAREFLSDDDANLLILSGDVPLLRAETLSLLTAQHEATGKNGAACTILTVQLDDPTGYGRVLRDSQGAFDRIVEQKDASRDELKIKEINSGIYCFNAKKLCSALLRIEKKNAQGEYYLTDAPRILREAGETVSLFSHTDSLEVSGINNRVELAEMERIIRERTISRLMLESGVSFIDPSSCYVSGEAKIGRDTIIHPNVSIEGASEVGENCVIRSGARITNSKIGSKTEILDGSIIVDSQIADKCNVGPYAHLRGNARMEEGAKVGNFVELKKTKLGRKSKANHLAYLGDATIGENTNIGAGTITCNYDGKNKHETKIGDNVKIGSDTMLIAPVEIGDGAVTGAGSVVTKDVKPNETVAGVPAKLLRATKTED
jgi:bifunctional UDP-N-acetylglucosamine pyrophosphorylase/glucosamine-1-phosphate N-acetyltransferase